MEFTRSVSSSTVASTAMFMTPVTEHLNDANNAVDNDCSSSPMLTGSSKLSAPLQCRTMLKAIKMKCRGLRNLSDVEADIRRLRSNEQERTRQKGITQAFEKLYQILPVNPDTTHKIGSKIYTLECATAYINGLKRLLCTSKICNRAQKMTVYSDPRYQKVKSLTTLWHNQPAREESQPDDKMRMPSVTEAQSLSQEQPSLFESYTKNALKDKAIANYQFSRGNFRTTLSVKRSTRNDPLQKRRSLPYVNHRNQPMHYPQSSTRVEQQFGKPFNEKTSTFLSRHEFPSFDLAQPSPPCIQKQIWMNQCFNGQGLELSTPYQNSKLQLTTPMSLIDFSTDHPFSFSMDFYSTPNVTVCPEAALSVNMTSTIHSSSSSFTPNSSHHLIRRCSQNDSGYLSCPVPSSNRHSACCYDNNYRISADPHFLELNDTKMITFSPERVKKNLGSTNFCSKEQNYQSRKTWSTTQTAKI